MADIPRIQKVSEIGETPFRVMKVEEKILQGFDIGIRKSVYLFKDALNNWAYYDTDLKQTIEVPEWRDKEALIKGRWVKMSLYYRLHIAFETPVTYSAKAGGSYQNFQTYQALITITKEAFEKLQTQMSGRPEESYYKFAYKILKKGAAVKEVSFVK